MEVFENHHQRLIERFAQSYALDRLQRAPLPDLPVHLREWIITLDNTEQAEQIGQCVFQTSIERYDSSCDLLAALALIVPGGNVEIIAQQIDDRQIGAGLAVRDREGLQHHPAQLRSRLELEKQP